MRTDAFDYHLPREQIAQHPAERRDESRLLVLHRATGRREHRRFGDIVQYLSAGDTLVVNDTEVLPARLVGARATGGWVAVLLVSPIEAADGADRAVWRAMAKCRGRLVEGETLAFEGGALTCTLRAKHGGGNVELAFDRSAEEVLTALRAVGRAPLPPYIRRPRGDDPDRAIDRERYQTVYAARPGAIAAPTAGLHFTPELLALLADKGIGRATVTLHVGLGTFKPVTADHVAAHVMHAEYYELSAEAAAAIQATRQAGGRVVTVGTTATRVLEAAAQKGPLAATTGWTDIFITPGYEFRLLDGLVTNFHLPRSTLLMLVAAFAGLDAVLAAYEEAVQLGYRFYSYGDAMLIL
ncbi:tRNA preQ1(34) S-adenosylmethionine ribosyltransferase-isomerase QueA [bacterium]|nr:tRNA preQ1(34) S-adenosylmethionine ribosyltransferase-isomerase QueA [bacterium]